LSSVTFVTAAIGIVRWLLAFSRGYVNRMALGHAFGPQVAITLLDDATSGIVQI
jgi:hypothetical protein